MKRAIPAHDLLVAFLETQIVVDRVSDHFFQPYGISAAQFNILNLLAQSGGTLEQASLTEQLVVGKSSISIVLRRMEENGLIRREKHTSDKRQSVLELTKRGRELWEAVHGPYEETIERVFGSIPIRQRAAFIKSLQAICSQLAD